MAQSVVTLPTPSAEETVTPFISHMIVINRRSCFATASRWAATLYPVQL
jgi:hypothetical protein